MKNIVLCRKVERYTFNELNGKPTCLIGMQNIAVAKEHNIRRHYNSKHASKYDKFRGKLGEKKLKELQKSLQNQLSVFTYFHQTGNAVVKASYRIAQQIAMSSKAFSEGAQCCQLSGKSARFSGFCACLAENFCIWRTADFLADFYESVGGPFAKSRIREKM